MKMLRMPAFLVFTLLISLLAPAAVAAPGDLDTTFANGGKLLVGFGGTVDIAYSSVLQADGKLIMVGVSANQFTLVRLDTNGLPDSSFGYLGKTVFAPAQVPYQSPKYVRVQADGKIVVAGDSYLNGVEATVISRFNTNGTPDTSFGSPNGYVTRGYGQPYQRCTAMALLSDGRIAFAGTYSLGGGEPRYFITRVLANGDSDPALVGGGFVSTNYSSISDMIIQSDNKFLVAGYDNGNGVMRFNENGTRDSGFGTGGKVIIPTGTSISSVAIQLGTIRFRIRIRLLLPAAALLRLPAGWCLLGCPWLGCWIEVSEEGWVMSLVRRSEPASREAAGAQLRPHYPKLLCDRSALPGRSGQNFPGQI